MDPASIPGSPVVAADARSSPEVRGWSGGGRKRVPSALLCPESAASTRSAGRGAPFLAAAPPIAPPQRPMAACHAHPRSKPGFGRVETAVFRPPRAPENQCCQPRRAGRTVVAAVAAACARSTNPRAASPSTHCPLRASAHPGRAPASPSPVFPHRSTPHAPSLPSLPSHQPSSSPSSVASSSGIAPAGLESPRSVLQVKGEVDERAMRACFFSRWGKSATDAFKKPALVWRPVARVRRVGPWSGHWRGWRHAGRVRFGHVRPGGKSPPSSRTRAARRRCSDGPSPPPLLRFPRPRTRHNALITHTPNLPQAHPLPSRAI